MGNVLMSYYVGMRIILHVEHRLICYSLLANRESMRPKANDRMSGNNEKYLSNKDLKDLIRYLRYKFPPQS